VRVEADDITAVDEPAKYLKLSKSALHERPQANRLPGQKISKRWRLHKAAVDRWVQRDPAPGDSGATGR